MIKENQITDKVLVVRPASFGFNEETAITNTFQKSELHQDQQLIQGAALREFDHLVNVLGEAGVQVYMYEDSVQPVKPDAIFPNNWITTHSDGSLITYPFLAASRRPERREDIVEDLEAKFNVHQRYSFETYEEDDLFLEGTGSMILDRVNHVVYACLSPRTHIELLEKFALLKQFRKIVFHAIDPLGHPIYHTNVIMAIGRQVAVICLDCIADDEEKEQVLKALDQTNKKIINLSWQQVKQFAGNMLQLVNKEGQPLWLMSEAAHQSLTAEQKAVLNEDGKIIAVPIPTIEQYGGGSVRCMLAELFLPPKKK